MALAASVLPAIEFDWMGSLQVTISNCSALGRSLWIPGNGAGHSDQLRNEQDAFAF
jgi:hypothetical protein